MDQPRIGEHFRVAVHCFTETRIAGVGLEVRLERREDHLPVLIDRRRLLPPVVPVFQLQAFPRVETVQENKEEHGGDSKFLCARGPRVQAKVGLREEHQARERVRRRHQPEISPAVDLVEKDRRAPRQRENRDAESRGSARPLVLRTDGGDNQDDQSDARADDKELRIIRKHAHRSEMNERREIVLQPRDAESVGGPRKTEAAARGSRRRQSPPQRELHGHDARRRSDRNCGRRGTQHSGRRLPCLRALDHERKDDAGNHHRPGVPGNGRHRQKECWQCMGQPPK